jgi:hypothetical protein
MKFGSFLRHQHVPSLAWNYFHFLLHDNARPYTENLTKATLATKGWEIMNHTPYSPDLGLSDFHSSGPIKAHRGGQKYQTDDELNRGQDKTF